MSRHWRRSLVQPLPLRLARLATLVFCVTAAWPVAEAQSADFQYPAEDIACLIDTVVVLNANGEPTIIRFGARHLFPRRCDHGRSPPGISVTLCPSSSFA